MVAEGEVVSLVLTVVVEAIQRSRVYYTECWEQINEALLYLNNKPLSLVQHRRVFRDRKWHHQDKTTEVFFKKRVN